MPTKNSRVPTRRKVLAFQARPRNNPPRMATDDILGRSYTFWDRSEAGYVVSRTVEVVGFDPSRGWKLGGSGFEPTWVPFDLWERLLEEEVLVIR